MNRRTTAALITTAALATTLTGCATATTPPDLIALHYKGGTLAKKQFVNCLDPSDRSGYNPGDKYIGYPTRQVSFDATGDSGAEAKPFSVVSKDNAVMEVPATVTFQLKTDCKTLRKFHETIGARYTAGFDVDDKDGSGQKNPGWVKLLKYAIGKPMDASLDRQAQTLNWRELWNDPAAKNRLEQEVNSKIAALVTRQAGGDFFEGFSVLIQKPIPPAGLTDAISQEQEGVALARAARAKANADVTAKNAEVAVAAAEARKRKAAINGYRLKGMSAKDAVRAYNESLMIQAGQNPRQPQYIVGGVPPSASATPDDGE